MPSPASVAGMLLAVGRILEKIEPDMPINSRFKQLAYQIFAPGSLVREKYDAFKDLLDHDKRAHELMAELEEIYHGRTAVDMSAIEASYRAFSESVAAVIDSLARMAPAHRKDLEKIYQRFDGYVRFMLTSPKNAVSPPYVMTFDEVHEVNQELIGGKAMHLAHLRRRLGLPVPAGFFITANAFNLFIERNHLRDKINRLLVKLDAASEASLNAVSEELIQLIERGKIPPEVEEAAGRAVESIWPSADKKPALAVRSSAVSEDSHSSFAGQYDTVLNVSPRRLISAYRQVIASKYSPRALFYRINCGLSDVETPMAVLVLEMVAARASGVMYTHDDRNTGLSQSTIHAVPGLGDRLVDGSVSPDVIRLDSNDPPEMIERRKADRDGKPPSDGERKQTGLAIEDGTAITLAMWGRKLSRLFGQDQDVEWSLDHDGQLFVLQSRPLGAGLNVDPDEPHCDTDAVDAEPLIEGAEKASAGAGGGPVYRIEGEDDLDTVPAGAVLAVRHASPRYVSALSRVAAVVAETGSTAGHFASVAREFGVPLLVNARGAFGRLDTAAEVTVHADAGIVYRGLVQSLLQNGCARTRPIDSSPYMRRLSSVMSFISPLRLLDPDADNFKPLGCRSMHDIVRFCHETAVREMFHLGNRRIRKIGGSRRLDSPIPMQFLVLDVGGGLDASARNGKTVGLEDIVCPALKALIGGLSHPEIQWGDFSHFDWAEHDRIVMGGGIISPESAMFASHVVLSEDYANLNLRFGYHFVIIDTICGDEADKNHILFRFSGGGADFEKRMLRADFLSAVLRRLEFDVHRKSDLVDADLKAARKERVLEKLDMLGRLLGASRLMDMYLKDESMVNAYVEEFMQGRYHFSTTDL